MALAAATALAVVAAPLIATTASATVTPDQGPAAGGTSVTIDHAPRFTDVIAVENGGGYALTDDGHLVGWGWVAGLGQFRTQDELGLPALVKRGPDAPETYISITSFGRGLVAVGSDGQLYWVDSSDQLVRDDLYALPDGVRITKVASSPVAASGLNIFTASDGLIYFKGWDTSPVQPMPAASMPAGVAVAKTFALDSRFGFITDTNEVYVWGWNLAGLTGIDVEYLATPTRVPLADGFVDAQFASSQALSQNPEDAALAGVTSDGTPYLVGTEDMLKEQAGIEPQDPATANQYKRILFPLGQRSAGEKIVSVDFFNSGPNVYSLVWLSAEGKAYVSSTDIEAMPKPADGSSFVFDNLAPSGLPNDLPIVDISLTWRAAYAIASDGRIYTWGAQGNGTYDGFNGALGRGLPAPNGTDSNLDALRELEPKLGPWLRPEFVDFGGTSVADFSVDTDGHIVTTAPAGTPGSTVDVAVTSCLSAGDRADGTTLAPATSAQCPRELPALQTTSPSTAQFAARAVDTNNPVPNASIGFAATASGPYTYLGEAAISYQFVAADGSALPAAVTALLPAASTAAQGDTVTPVAPASTTVTTDAGTWTFTSWSPASVVAGTEDITFVGTWSFAPVTATPTPGTPTPGTPTPQPATPAPTALPVTGSDAGASILAAFALLSAGVGVSLLAARQRRKA